MNAMQRIAKVEIKPLETTLYADGSGAVLLLDFGGFWVGVSAGDLARNPVIHSHHEAAKSVRKIAFKRAESFYRSWIASNATPEYRALNAAMYA